ncbi:MAG TPA: hypothetical protein PKA16_01330 [Ottowia sp.]|uniref:hypothetical protein n=1 Tax=Ottowia sp. TaxID=1898956 RepID=UPI002CFDF446|nr:hypothetical protein [Ottowia sp.]HMN20014.1 hypothetical protein [Ottowia sp.]
MRLTTLAFAAALALGLAGCSTPGTTQAPAAPATTASATAQTAPKLHAAMRSLWHGHIVATRDYALAVHAGKSANAQQAEAAAIDNAKQIASAVAGFYGQAGGDGILKLLGGHWGGVKALTLAAQGSNAAAEQKAMDNLAVNAGQIAKFLAGANPANWTESALDGALLMHVGDHKQQVDAMMANAPAAQQAQLWTDMQHHMDMIADALSDGIAKQFPAKVS